VSDIAHRLTEMHRRGHARPIHGLRRETMPPGRDQRPAAVLIAVTERKASDGHGPGVILIERPAKMRKHAGQVAFPGGAIDPGEGPVEAALREAHEEIALPLSKVNVIGTTDVFDTATGFKITPVLATIPPDLPLNPNPAEVDEWFEAPLSFVLDHANHDERHVEWEGSRRRYIEMFWEGHRIWGVTAAIIENLAIRLAWREGAR